MITRKITLYNKKISFTQKHMDANRKNDLINDFKDINKNKRVNFNFKLNPYVFINVTKF